MGYFSGYSSKETLVKDLLQDYKNVKLIRHSLQGSCLWSIWESGERKFIRLDLIKLFSSRKGFKDYGYKNLCEMDFPFYFNCPLSFFPLVPVACLAWRIKVQAYWAIQKEKRIKK